MKTVIKTCAILFNSIIDFECYEDINSTYIDGLEYIPLHPPLTILPRTENEVAKDRINMIAEMKENNQHNCLNTT